MPRFRPIHALPALALLLPLPAAADQFSGLSAGVGASSFSLDIDATFDHSGADDRSVTADGSGGMVDIGYGFLPSSNVHLQAGVRRYPIELEENVYPDDCVKIDQHTAVYGQVGYLLDPNNMLYGIFESGRADVSVHTLGYPDEEFDANTFAFGVGYKHALGPYVEFFVEGMSRSYDNLHIHYEGAGTDEAEADYDGDKKDIELASTNVTAGFQVRF